MSRLTEKNKFDTHYGISISKNLLQSAYDKLGKLEDLEEELGCPLEVLVRAFKLYVNWTEECDFGYDNIPDEYEKYKDDKNFKKCGYIEGLMYIAIQEALEDKSE